MSNHMKNTMKSLTTSECPQSGPVIPLSSKEVTVTAFVLSGNWGGTASNRPRRQRNLAPGILYFINIKMEGNYDYKDQKLLDFIG